MKLNRRNFLIAAGSTATVRVVPQIAKSGSGRRILTLVYDKSLGMMRAVERVVR